MKTVYIEGAFTTQLDIDNCIAAFTEMQPDLQQRKFTLEAKQKLQDIDIQLLGYFMLYREQMADLLIWISLPFNADKNDQVNWKIRTCANYCFLMTRKETFRLIAAGTIELFELTGKLRFKTNTFGLPKNFMFLLFVKKQEQLIYDLLFETGLATSCGSPLNTLRPQVSWERSNKNLVKSVNRDIVSRASPSAIEQAIVYMGELAFYNILFRAEVLPMFTDPQFRQNPAHTNSKIRAGQLITIKEGEKLHHPQYQYFEQIRPVLAEICNSSILFLLILSTLMNEGRFPEPAPGQAISPATIFKRLWNFTKQLGYGLKELAKNMREHTSEGCGALTGKIYDRHILQEFLSVENTSSGLFADYMSENQKEISGDISSYLDFNVIDIGNTGVIPSLLEHTQKLQKKYPQGSTLEKLYLQDYNSLQQGRVAFREMLIPDKRHALHQQSKRAIAHYGLMVFNRLITHNKGLIIASSQSVRHDRETVISPERFAAWETYTAAVGTHYRILLPVHHSTDFLSKYPEIQFQTPESSPSDILGLEELFSFQQVQETEFQFLKDSMENGTEQPAHGTKKIATLKVGSTRIVERHDEAEVWENIDEKARLAIGSLGSVAIFNLDFGQANLDGSHLLRLIAMWNIEYPKRSLIISNICTSAFEEILLLNEELLENTQGLDYWNRNSAVVFYHYSRVGSDRFYFADALWGASKGDHLLLNKMIARTNFNYHRLTDTMASGSLSANLPRPMNRAFFNTDVLLPLDILLKGNAKRSLFEHNSIVLLKNEIKPISKS